MRVGAELRGSSASLTRASKRSSISFVMSLATVRSSRRLAANFFTSRRRRLFFSIELFLAMYRVSGVRV
jgi:hypothetical protein